MRIACDARPLLGERTGVSVWLEGLLRGLAGCTDWSFVLCVPRPVGGVGLDDLRGRVSLLAPPVPLPGTLWLHTLAAPLAAAESDVFLATLGVLPRRLAIPAAVVVHDLTPRTLPGRHTLANRFCFNAYLEGTVEEADAVVVDSRATRDALAAAFPQHARRAVVVPPAVDGFFTPPPPSEGRQGARERHAAGRPFLLQLGTLEPRKGVDVLLAAHGELLLRRRDGPDLVLAGKPGWGGDWLPRALASHPDRSRVHLPGYVSRLDARELLRHAEVVVLASEEEGFGLPLGEALACGAACVASDAPSLLEVSGGAALHVARRDPAALAAALERALDPAVNGQLRAAALRRAPALGWPPVLDAWCGLLRSLAAPGPAH